MAYPSSIHSDEGYIEVENPVQNVLLGGTRRDRPQRERISVAVAEKIVTAVPKKVKFSENLSKVFPKADKIFDNELKNDDISYAELSEITKPNTQLIFKELNDWKIPDELKKILGRNEGANALRFMR